MTATAPPSRLKPKTQKRLQFFLDLTDLILLMSLPILTLFSVFAVINILDDMPIETNFQGMIFMSSLPLLAFCLISFMLNFINKKRLRQKKRLSLFPFYTAILSASYSLFVLWPIVTTLSSLAFAPVVAAVILTICLLYFVAYLQVIYYNRSHVVV